MDARDVITKNMTVSSLKKVKRDKRFNPKEWKSDKYGEGLINSMARHAMDIESGGASGQEPFQTGHTFKSQKQYLKDAGKYFKEKHSKYYKGKTKRFVDYVIRQKEKYFHSSE